MEEPVLSKLDVLSNVEIKMQTVLAMTRLMEKTPFDKLKIGEICEEANISHATFYRYFSDKYAVVQWYCDYIYSQGVDEIGRTLSWYEGYYVSETMFAKMRDFFGRAAKSQDYNALDNYAPRARQMALEETLTRYHQAELTTELLFQIEAVAAIEVHMFPKWHYGEFDVPLDEFCKWMVDLVPEEIFVLLNTPLDQKPSGHNRRPRR